MREKRIKGVVYTNENNSTLNLFFHTQRSSTSPDITLRVKCKAKLEEPGMNRNGEIVGQVHGQMTKYLQQHTQEIFTDMNAPHSTLK